MTDRFSDWSKVILVHYLLVNYYTFFYSARNAGGGGGGGSSFAISSGQNIVFDFAFGTGVGRDSGSSLILFTRLYSVCFVSYDFVWKCKTLSWVWLYIKLIYVFKATRIFLGVHRRGDEVVQRIPILLTVQ